MYRSILPFVSLFAMVLAAGAQTATLTVSHSDADGIVVPGQTVTITATASWDGGGSIYTFWEARGDVTTTNDLGTASNNRFGWRGDRHPHCYRELVQRLAHVLGSPVRRDRHG